jgi:hypothetical protein
MTQRTLVLIVAFVSLHACVSLTEQEREQIAYDLNEARAIYGDRRQVCLESNGSMVTESLMGTKRLSISEMKWAYCRW